MLSTTSKPKACSYEPCGKSFLPLRPMQQVCSPLCASKKVRADKAVRRKEQAAKAKVERATTKARRRELETIPELLKAAQREFNKWVRWRDNGQPCVSCGNPPPDLSSLHAGRDAGHYRSVGSAPHLRFNEDNCHAQCVHCNQWKSGSAVDYRIRLLERIGVQRVDALETDNQTHKWTRDELRQLRATYRAKLKALQSTRKEEA